MKRITWSVAMLLLPLVAQAACYKLDFSAPYPDPFIPIGEQLHWQTIGGGFSAYFGGAWHRGFDCDQAGLGNTCHPCTGQGHYIPIPDGGPPGRQREDDSGDFANEPSPGCVAWLTSGWIGSNGGSGDSVQITLSQDARAVSFWYSSSITYTYWSNSQDSCGYGGFSEIAGPLEPNPNPRTVSFISAQPAIVGSVVLDQPGTRDETGCVGDPLGSACKWTHVVFATSGDPVHRVRFNIGALGPFFMDDLTVCDTPTLDVPTGSVQRPREGYYDLAGRKLKHAPRHGVYWNGRKVVGK